MGFPGNKHPQCAGLSFNEGVKSPGCFWKKRCSKNKMFTKPVLLLACSELIDPLTFLTPASPSAASHPKVTGETGLAQLQDFNELPVTRNLFILQDRTGLGAWTNTFTFSSLNCPKPEFTEAREFTHSRITLTLSEPGFLWIWS